MSTEKEKQIRKAAITSGLVLGLVSSIFSIFSFYFTTGMTSNFWMIIFSPLLFGIIIPIVIAIFIVLDLRKKIGGYWNFRQAVSGIFVMLIVSAIISYLVVNLLFAKVIEPDMADKTKIAMSDALTSMLEKANSPQEKIDESIAEMEKNFDEQKHITVGKTLMNFGIAVIILFVVSLIFAAIFKKEPPKYFEDPSSDPEPAV